MASSANDDQDQSKTMNGYPPPPPVTGYPTVQPHSAGYPPYQGYAPPYPAGYPNVYPYTAPPPAAFYSTPIYQSMPPERGRRSFARIILWMMIILFFGAFVMSFLTWLIFGTAVPAFRVESLSVPTFKIANSTTLTAKWEANVTVTNHNKKLDIFYYHTEAIMFYYDEPLAMSSLDPLYIGKNEKRTFVANLSTMSPGNDNGGESSMLLKDIDEDRRNGDVTFNMRIVVRGTIASGTIWRRKMSLRVLCDKLEVQFEAATGVGTLINNNRKDCIIYS
uniref:Late embryogenesis abundant protein LEA-2 subgroup domain-containing protein n=1 Tax=Davidia involucrata TaxID=16924 RepID=A0A5B7BUT4_DAVIN